jgi:hypothetical protein
MKTTIKTLIALLVVTNAFAFDRIVQENGPTGTFPTISAAVTAAVDGDRIIIYPKIGDNPYVENITINKSLEFASAEDGVRYKIQGDISLVALNSRTISIIGAHLVSGSISGVTAGWKTNVNIMGCILDSGEINFNNQYYVTIVSNVLVSGNITISHGKIIGNDLQGRTISIGNSTSIIDDTMNIIANKCSNINCSTDIKLNIYNNFIKKTNNINNPGFNSISYSHASATNSKLNIINNTILTAALNSNGYSSTARPYYFNLASPAVIKNNIFQTATLSVSYYLPFFLNVANTTRTNNYIYDSVTSNIPSPSLYYVASVPVNESTGQLLLPTPALNGADPSFEFYDLDLSVGDAGCFGGSYSLDNYFPITGSSRVYNIDMPFGITTTGAPLNIKADGFDR